MRDCVLWDAVSVASAAEGGVEAHDSLHLVEMVCDARELGVEEVGLCADDFEICAAAVLEELAGVFYVLAVEGCLLRLENAALVVGVVADEGVADFVARLEDHVLPVVVGLLLLCLCHLQPCH